MGPSTLKIDYDTEREILTNGAILNRLARAGYRTVRLERRTSPSGRGQHVLIDVTPAPRSKYAIIALQAILGSDPYREACNVQRVRGLKDAPPFWRVRWNVLYKRRPYRDPIEVKTWPS